jgi:phage FluMu protein Com
MPTEEQIKDLVKSRTKEYRYTSTKNRSKRRATIYPEELETILCAKCLKIVRDLFGGSFLYIHCKKWKTKEIENKVEKLLKMGKSEKEIIKELNMKQPSDLRRYLEKIMRRTQQENEKN